MRNILQIFPNTVFTPSETLPDAASVTQVIQSSPWIRVRASFNAKTDPGDSVYAFIARNQKGDTVTIQSKTLLPEDDAANHFGASLRETTPTIEALISEAKILAQQLGVALPQRPKLYTIFDPDEFSENRREFHVDFAALEISNAIQIALACLNPSLRFLMIQTRDLPNHYLYNTHWDMSLACDNSFKIQGFGLPESGTLK